MSSSWEHRISETPQFRKDIQYIAKIGLGKTVVKLVEHVYPILRRHPHFGPNIRKLKGHEPYTYRYRIGDWRFFYEIDDDKRIVYMKSADHRKEAYR